MSTIIDDHIDGAFDETEKVLEEQKQAKSRNKSPIAQQVSNHLGPYSQIKQGKERKVIKEKTRQKIWKFRKLTTNNRQRLPEQGPFQ